MTTSHRRTIVRRAGRTAAVTAAAAALTVGGASMAFAAPGHGEASPDATSTTEEWTIEVDVPGQEKVTRQLSAEEGQGWLDQLFGGGGDWSWSDLFGSGETDAEALARSTDGMRGGGETDAEALARSTDGMRGEAGPDAEALARSTDGMRGEAGPDAEALARSTDGMMGEASAAQPGAQETAAVPRGAAPAERAPASPAPQSRGSLTSEEQIMLDAVNTQRASVGCAPVAADAKLTAAARAHADDMVDRDYFDHTGLDGSTPWDRAERAGTTANAENIAAGQSSGAESAEGLWNSPGHRANIANCDATRVGIGNGVGDGGPGAVGGGTWVQLFAS